MLFNLAHPARGPRSREAPRARPVEHQPDGRRVFGLGNLFAHLREAARRGHAHRQIENMLGQLRQAAELRAAAGEHDSGGNLRFEAGAAQIVANQHQQFLRARLDDFGKHARENGARRAVAHAGNFDGEDPPSPVRETRRRARA